LLLISYLTIYVDCVKHFKYETEIYKKIIDKKDIVNIRSFLNEYETRLQSRGASQQKYSSTNGKVSSSKSVDKKFINDNTLTGVMQIKTTDNVILSKYKTMLKNIMDNKKNNYIKK
jgi:hypothetical protein